MTAFPEPDGEPELDDFVAPKTRKPAAKAKPKARTSSSPTSLQGQIKELVEAIGGGVSFINPDDGRIIVVQAEPLASALDRLAKQNPNVRRALQGLLVGGAWGEVLSIVLIGIALPIASNHQALPWQRPRKAKDTKTTGEPIPVIPKTADLSGVVRSAEAQADALLAELGEP